MSGNKSDSYAECVGGSLKLKSVGGVKKKKKKKKNKAEEVVETIKKIEETKEMKEMDKRTPAQIAYDKVKEQRQAERILKKAQKTHKQRVEELNRHLDSLTEHYDIPKVSWTK